MRKTDIDIRDDVYRIVKESYLSSEITGKVCTRQRPANSTKEDVVISVLSNNIADKQQAFVNVNVYVRDILVGSQNEEDTKRLRTLARICLDMFDSISDEYWITINEQKIYAIDSIGYHVINNKLLYQYIDK